MTKRDLTIGAAFVATLGTLGLTSTVLHRSAKAAGTVAQQFEVDPLWPKPLPNHWVMG